MNCVTEMEEIMEESSSVDFDPATSSGWLWTADNLTLMAGFEDNIIDLIYLDPPFNSNADYINIFNTVDQEIVMKFRDIWNPTDDDRFVLDVIQNRVPNLPIYINAIGTIAGERMKSYLIFMAIRLLEMKRILKNTGSIFLHCDPTASHFLKGLMDGIFGTKNFRNEIVWCYTGPSAPKQRQFSRKHDVIFWYNVGDKWSFNAEQVKIPYADGGPHQGGFKSDTDPGMDIAKTQKYGKEGKIPETWWAQAPGNGFAPASRQKGQYVGYPTQKPLALLERIILAASNEGDLIFDPFAGCATTVIMANLLNRRWISCDIAEASVPILKKRIKENYDSKFPQLKNEQGGGFITDVINPKDLPERENSPQIKNSPKLRKLLALQALETDQVTYRCNGCHLPLPIRLLEIDHLVPIARGGDDSEKNRILLCSYCNRSKGHKTWEEWQGVPFPEIQDSKPTHIKQP